MTEVGRDGVHVGFHKKDVMVLSPICVVSQWYETTWMGRVLERVFWFELTLWKIESCERCFE